MPDFISIKDLRFHARHGHLPAERITGNTFVVDLKIETDLSVSGKSDNLNDTVDYVSIMELVTKEMEVPSDLIEHVAERIAHSIKKTHAAVTAVEVTVKKQKPPLHFDLKAVEVTIRR